MTRSATDVARATVDALLARGVRHAVIAPGSRSGPLALAVLEAERRGDLVAHVRIDERTAAFLALGIAKASLAPAVVLTTSGTAVAHLGPAMLEARHGRIPLLAVTADRPGELRGTGANQTTDQRSFFPGVPWVNVTAVADDDLASTLAEGGPVQVNVELDEPLLAPQSAAESRDVRWSYDDELPVTSGGDASLVLDAAVPTVVIAGDDAGWSARLLAEDAGWPLLAEPSSGARAGTHALRAYRLLLEHAPLADRIERVVMYGHPTLSRPVTRLLGRTDLEVVVVGPDLSRFPHPPGHAKLSPRDPRVTGTADPAWSAAWRSADARASAAIDAVVDAEPEITAWQVAREVAGAVRSGGLLFCGSSSPIRDLDLMAPTWPGGERRVVLANRGLAGIDGTVSSAIGAALVLPATRALAYLGDLTFLHDANGLAIGPGEPRPHLRFVVASDDGGAIFSLLEQGAPAYARDFERVFATPTGTDFAALCAAHGVPHARVGSIAELRTAVQAPQDGIDVVEVPLGRVDRRAGSAAIAEAVAAAL